jgi:hypothetical protein
MIVGCPAENVTQGQMNKARQMKPQFTLTAKECGIGTLMNIGHPVFLGKDGAFLLSGSSGSINYGSDIFGDDSVYFIFYFLIAYLLFS